MSTLYPEARREQLVVEHLQDEVLVYDLDRDQASCLNTTAALVWKYADGKTSVSEIADKMSRDLGMLVDVRVVWYALEQLNKKRLLQDRVAIPVEYSRMSRRDFLMKAGIVGAAVAIPVVIALAAPTPASAVTCVPSTCPLGTECQSPCTCNLGSCVSP